MVKFTPEEVRKIMGTPRNIRNISVIAHVDHGKSTLTDSLLAKAGLIAEKNAGLVRQTDTRPDEAERGITIKSTGVSLYYQLTEQHESFPGMDKVLNVTDKRDFLINLVDSPGHVDFSSEVTAALRITDGALVVVDCIEGVCVQTETVLRQALSERVKPVLVLNKMDRVLLELEKDPEECYKAFEQIIENTNVIISNYEDEQIGKCQVDPTEGTVAFGSGYQAWGFTLWDFAKLYQKRMGADPHKLIKKLWGDNYFDPKTKKWIKTPVTSDGRQLQRGFVQFVMDPIYQIFNSIKSGDMNKLDKVLKVIDVDIKPDEISENSNEPKKLIKLVMQRFLNLADALLQVIVVHLPSPVRAQSYRMEKLYSGPKDDEAAIAIKNCDPNGPVMMYVSKMIPSQDKGRFNAFGRVFSGTIKTGQKVIIMGPNHVYGTKKDKYHNKSIQRTVLMMAGKLDPVDDCPCGNTIGLVGVDDCLVKTGTITTLDSAHIFHDMKFSVSPVVQVAVKPKDSKDLPKLVEGLKKLAKSDPCVQVRISEEGEHVVAGVGELHVEICLQDLEEYAKVPIIKSNPVVPYRETILETSSITALSKSPNKHNRLYFTAEPINQELCTEIEEGRFDIKADAKELSRILQDNWNWSPDDTRKIWTFGPELNNTCAIVDQTKGVQYLNEIKDSCFTAFELAGNEGPLCGEPLRGVKFNVQDVVLHADAIHRGGGQIIPTARRVYYASILTAQPRLMEPIFLVSITGPQSISGGVYNVMNQRCGEVISEEQKDGGVMVEIRAYLPVAESFGFNEALRAATSGQAFPQMSFSHWEIIPSDPLEEGTKAHKLMLEIRKRKGLSESAPDLGKYLDKL